MSLDTFHFETLSKTVYSHGLEAIYALETVDIKTLKLMEEPKKVVVPKASPLNSFGEELPLEFPFRKTIPSTFLSLPVECLELPKSLIVKLKEGGVFFSLDLLEKREEIFKGLLRQERELLENCFERHFKGKNLHFCETIDWVNFLKGALFPIEKKGAYLLLKEYGLEHLIDLPLSLKLSVKTISPFLSKELIEGARAHLKTVSLKPFLDVFVVPWMRQRFSLASKEEVIERLIRVSETSDHADKIVSFLSEVASPFELTPLSEGVFTVDQFSRDKIYEIEAIAKTYFYKEWVVYPLKTLTRFILAELCSRFIYATEEEVNASLKYCPLFRVRRNREQILICHLS